MKFFGVPFSQLRPLPAVFLSSVNVLFFTALPWYVWTHNVPAPIWWAAALGILSIGLGITMGYHRLFAHRAYEAHWSVRLFAVLAGSFAITNSVLAWSNDHRYHHRYVDDKEQDPYPITSGFWYAHMGWIMDKRKDKPIDKGLVKDLMEDPIVMWQHKYYWVQVILLNVGLPLIVGLATGHLLASFLVFGVGRLVFSYHVQWLINSAAHYFGDQPYSEKNTARNSHIIGAISFGEGYHNYHHRFEYDYRNGYNWYEIDISKWLIFLLSKVGLARNLRRVPDWQVQRALENMRLKKLARKMEPDMWEQAKGALQEKSEQFITCINNWESLKAKYRENPTRELKQKMQAAKEKMQEAKRSCQLAFRAAVQGDLVVG